MNIEIRPYIVQKLNQQYKTSDFRSNMTAKEIVNCAEYALRKANDMVDYQLTS